MSLPVRGEMKYVLQEFEGHFQKMMKAEVPDEPRPSTHLRVSSFPYCGLRHAYWNIVNPRRYVNFGQRYYTSVGTATHSAIQQWIGLGGRVFGDWKCLNYKCNGKRRFSNINRCPKCKGPMEYVEFHVQAFGNVSGHLDGVYRARDGRWYVIDYKTSSTRVIEGHKTVPSLPYLGNRAQIKAYCALVELNFNIEISGWILFYAARDTPTKVFKATGGLITKDEKTKYLKRIRRWGTQFALVQNIRALADLKPLVEDKACKTKEFYEAYYTSYEGCPLAQDGVCFDPKRLTRTLKILWSECSEL